MYKGNLLKAAWNTVNQDDVKIIDSNAMLEKRIREANELFHDNSAEKISLDMVDGVDAFSVANLLNDEESEEKPESEETEETGDAVETVEQSVAEERAKAYSNIIKAAPVYTGPSPEEVSKEIEEKYKEAEQEAARIIAEAEERADSIRNAAHEQGKKAGFDEGYANGLAQMVEKEQGLKKKEQELEELYERKIEELEPQFVDALTGIYEHIFNVDLKDYREIIVHLITGTIRKVEGNKDFIVHVSREDYPYVSMQKKVVQASATAPNSSVEIIEDLTLAKSECMIETGGGIFDCGLGTELKELTAKLKMLSYEKKKEQKQ